MYYFLQKSKVSILALISSVLSFVPHINFLVSSRFANKLSLLLQQPITEGCNGRCVWSTDGM